MTPRFLTALPVYNEQSHLSEVLATVRQFAQDILVVDDGSTDATPELLRREPGIHIVTHSPNRGYGAALKSAFDFSVQHDYDVLVTIDCDGQHEDAGPPSESLAQRLSDWRGDQRTDRAGGRNHPQHRAS